MSNSPPAGTTSSSQCNVRSDAESEFSTSLTRSEVGHQGFQEFDLDTGFDLPLIGAESQEMKQVL